MSLLKARSKEAVILAVLALSLVAGAASASGRSSASAAKGKQVVRVFGLGVETSPALGALFPSFTEAVTEPQVAANAINKSAASKVKIQYTFCDTQAVASRSVTCAKQAASPTGCGGHRCDAAIEVGDPNDNLSAPVLSQAGIPTVSVDVGTTQAAATKGEFCIDSGSAATYSGLGYVEKRLGAKKVGIMSVDRPDASTDQSLIASALQGQGLSVAGEQIIPQSTASPNATIDSVMTGGADGLVDAVVGPVGSALQYAETTYPGVKIALPLIVATPSFFAGVPGSVIKGVGVSAISEPPSATMIPGIAKWRAEGGVAATAKGPSWANFAFTPLEWLAVHFIANVGDTVTGTISKKTMMRAFDKASNINMYGIVPPFNASAMGKAGALPCSPYNEIVAENLHSNGVAYADNPGTFVNAKTGKIEYVDPGIKK